MQVLPGVAAAQEPAQEPAQPATQAAAPLHSAESAASVGRAADVAVSDRLVRAPGCAYCGRVWSQLWTTLLVLVAGQSQAPLHFAWCRHLFKSKCRVLEFWQAKMCVSLGFSPKASDQGLSWGDDVTR